MNTIEIPYFLKHLSVDHRGYPIPFFVAYVKGKPDFRLLDTKKQLRAMREDLCGICGKELEFPFAWSISGPLGLKNCVSQDPLMHEKCARFSIMVCPHLALEKAQRRTSDDLYKKVHEKNPKYLVMQKQSEVYLIRAMSWEIIDTGGHLIYKFKEIGNEKFIYQEGKLVKA